MSIFPKGSKLKSIVEQKCPKCQEENLFTYSNPYRYKGYFEMPDRCPNCNQSFLLEPGFYYGAMYVNYGVTVAIAITTFLAMYILGSPWESWAYLVGIGLALLLTAPYTFRLARAVWINFFVSYDANATRQSS